MASGSSQTTCEPREYSTGSEPSPPSLSDSKTFRKHGSYRDIVLRDYQEDGIQWMINRERYPNKGGFLCDEMGLGKTIQMLMLVKTLGGSTLVVTPKSVAHQWNTEIKRFELEESVCVTTYQKIPEAGVFFQRIILDEGHEVRNRGTKMHKALKALKFNKCWIVTGTPVFNSISDFVNLASFIDVDKLDIQRDLEYVRDKVVLRRTRATIGNKTKCFIENIDLNMSPVEESLYFAVYEKCLQKYKNIIFKKFDEDNPNNKGSIEIMELFLRCRQMMIWPKMVLDEEAPDTTVKFEKLKEFINEHPDENTIIFSHFHAEMNQLCKMFRETHKVFRLDGSVNEESRISQIEKFQKSKGAIFIIQIKAGGQGINLQSASRVYITSPAWNPATELQAICRAYRIGQTRDVYVKRLVYTCDQVPSIEESIQELQNHKLVITSDVLADPSLAPVSRRVTATELKKFFQGQ